MAKITRTPPYNENAKLFSYKQADHLQQRGNLTSPPRLYKQIVLRQTQIQIRMIKCKLLRECSFYSSTSLAVHRFSTQFGMSLGEAQAVFGE